MLLSTLLQKNRVVITPEIRSLIEKFRNPQISDPDKEEFLKRVKSLQETNLFGVYDFDKCNDSTNIWDLARSSYDPYKYATLEFARKFPEFERLFVEIWILMNAEKVQPSYDRDNRVEYYCYQHRTISVEITINENSVKIVIPNMLEITI